MALLERDAIRLADALDDTRGRLCQLSRWLGTERVLGRRP
jgi:hypothetical protein